MLNIKGKLARAAFFFRLDSWFRLIFLCVLIGIIAGLASVVFDLALEYFEGRLLQEWLFIPASKSQGRFAEAWPLLVVPAAGGALAGLFALWLAPEAAGQGMNAVIRAFHRGKGAIRARVPLVKGLCSLFTIASGGSAGKEGPIVQIGAGFGSNVATLLHISVRDRRILMLAGVAGGIGAIFKAPLGGALFAAEMLYREPDFEHDAIIPGVISSVTAYSVLTALLGHERILQFSNPEAMRFPSPGGSFWELAHYAALSILCAFVAFLFVKGYQFIRRRLFEPLYCPKFLKPALGGLLLGLLALALLHATGETSAPGGPVLGGSRAEHIMGQGYGFLQKTFSGVLDPTAPDPSTALKLAGFLAVVILAKILATCFTIGSGGSGGLLFPALFLGGLTGAAYSRLWQALNGLGLAPANLALTPLARADMVLVGMGGVFAACTKTPIASLVLVSEITGSYGLVVPLMLACTSAYLLSRSFTINEEQVMSLADSPAHRGDFLGNVLEEITVAEATAGSRKLELFPADTPCTQILERIKGSSASAFPVVDEQGFLLGVFSLGDLRQIMNEPHLGNLVVAGDLVTANIATVTLNSNLDEALGKFTRQNVDELPVVEDTKTSSKGTRSFLKFTKRPRGPVGTKRVIGMLSRRDLIMAYHRKLLALRTTEAHENKGARVLSDAPELSTFSPPPGKAPAYKPRISLATAARIGKELISEPKDDSEK
jgi:CIC family chloride channel protein